jgi:hypothetical protein
MSVVGDDDTNSDDGAAAVARAQRVFQLPAGLSLSGRTSKNAFPLQLLREMQADPTSRVRLESGELVSCPGLAMYCGVCKCVSLQAWCLCCWSTLPGTGF